MTFDEWYEKEGRESFEYNGSYTLTDLRDAWNAAIESAELVVKENYDESEPWLEPGQLTESLKA